MPRQQGVTPPEEKWKLLHLFNRIQSYKDEGGRQLSESLQKTPTQKEDPEYHKLVSRPIDFSGIIIKIQKEQYHAVDELIEDLLLLFNNTVKVYNKYTQIYKDALTLHCVLLQAQTELMDLDHDRVEVPDVQQCVQEILKTIYDNILNFQDESGKYLMTALVNFLERECSEEMLLIDFSTVSNKLFTGCYQRLDQMQKDLFSIFEKIRHLSKENQEIYYASVRLQEYYILSREQVCEWGQVLDSPALRYINGHLQSDLKVEKAMEKAGRSGGSPDSTSDIDVDYSNMTVPLINMRTNERVVKEDGCPSFEQYVTETGCYKVGDCVYLHPEGRNKPGIAKIDILWEDKEGIPWCQGPVFLYPEDTKHLPTTVFYEKEVFQGQSVVRQMSDVIGKCVVLHLSDYIRGRCTEIAEDDVFVYRCRYEEGREFWKCGQKTGQKQGSKQVPSDEWYFFKKPLQLWVNQGSPFLQDALQECLIAGEPFGVAEKSDRKASTVEEKEEGTASGTAESTEEVTETVLERPELSQPAQPEEQTYDADADDAIDFEHNRRVKFTNGYPLFLREKYSSFKRKFPGKTINEIRRMIHLKWKKLDSDQQMEYHLKAREKIKKNFNKSTSRRNIGRISKSDQRTRTQVVTPSILNIRVPKIKPNNDQRGKHCRRGFNMLVADMHGQLKEQYPDSTKKDLMKIINEKWQSLSKEEQERFHVRARESMLKRQIKKYGKQLDYMETTEADGEREEMELDPDENQENGEVEQSTSQENDDLKLKKKKKAFGYALFVKEWYKLTSKIHPNKSRLEVYQLIHDKWAGLSREDQLVYNRKAQGGPLRPRKTSMKAGIRVTNDLQQPHPLGKRQKKVKLARAYSTGYNIFSKDVYPGIRKSNPGTPHIELMKIVGRHWKTLEASKQDKYVKEALERRKLGQQNAEAAAAAAAAAASAAAISGSSSAMGSVESPGDLQRANGPEVQKVSVPKQPHKLSTPSYDTSDISMSMRSPFYRFYKRWSKRLSEKFKGKPKGSLKKCIVAKWQALPEDEKEPYKEPYRIRREAKRRRLLAEKMRKSKIKTVRELLSEKRTDSETSGETIIDTGELDNDRFDDDDDDALDLSRQTKDSVEDVAPGDDPMHNQSEAHQELDSTDPRASKDTREERSASTTPPLPPYAKRGKTRGRSKSPSSGEAHEGRVCTRYQAAASRRASVTQLETSGTVAEKSNKNANSDTEASVHKKDQGRVDNQRRPSKEFQRQVEESGKNEECENPEHLRDEMLAHEKSPSRRGRISPGNDVVYDSGNMAPPMHDVSVHGQPVISTTTTTSADHSGREYHDFEMRLREVAEEDESLPLPGSVRLYMDSEDMGETITLLRCLIGRCDFLCNKRAWMKMHLQIEHKKFARQRRSSCSSSSRSETPMSDSTTRSIIATPDKPVHATLDPHKLSVLSHFPLHMAANVLKAEELNSNSPSSGAFQMPSTDILGRGVTSSAKNEDLPNSNTAPFHPKVDEAMSSYLGRAGHVSTPPPSLSKELPTTDPKQRHLVGKLQRDDNTYVHLAKKRSSEPEEGQGPVDLSVPMKKRKFTPDLSEHPADFSDTAIDSKEGLANLVIGKSWSVSPGEQLWLDSHGEINSHGHKSLVHDGARGRGDLQHSRAMNPQDMKSSCFVSRMRGQTLEPFENVIEKKNRGRPRRGTSPDGHYAPDHMHPSVGLHAVGANSSPDSGYASSNVEAYLHGSSHGHGSASRESHSSSTHHPAYSRDSAHNQDVHNSQGIAGHSATHSSSSHSTPGYGGTFPVMTSMLQKRNSDKDVALPTAEKLGYYQRLVEADIQAPLQMRRPEQHSQQSGQGPPELTPQSQVYMSKSQSQPPTVAEALPNLANLLEKQNAYQRTSNMPGLIKVGQHRERRPQQENDEVIITAENLSRNSRMLQGRGRVGTVTGQKRTLEPFTGMRDRTEALARLGLQRSGQTNH